MQWKMSSRHVTVGHFHDTGLHAKYGMPHCTVKEALHCMHPHTLHRGFLGSLLMTTATPVAALSTNATRNAKSMKARQQHSRLWPAIEEKHMRPYTPLGFNFPGCNRALHLQWIWTQALPYGLLRVSSSPTRFCLQQLF